MSGKIEIARLLVLLLADFIFTQQHIPTGTLRERVGERGRREREGGGREERERERGRREEGGREGGEREGGGKRRRRERGRRREEREPDIS